MADSKNVGVVNARGLNITRSDDRRYWRWVKETETSDDVAELLNLSQGTQYEVVLVAKMKTRAYGWDAPVNFKLTHADTTNHGTINLEDMFKDSKDQWKDIKLGEFLASANQGNIEFWLYKFGGKWKSGLVIKSVAVRPKS
ncbi:protein PHLOEM PROTEIN 2-LIKE A1 [Prunus yedoensis var. nudiflora]|uniref:Protein PHLOEM PROTEIN 2-LIKE A1 n=1 Tax=Prunus yedoensis var. nudiflora TaxID=2094558 RepID=A0A314UNM7_PRUYE|nr:protein PHLOEM PROTEIN 2-LIKE A1 [Prunus yedoensis var. nudiflora]